jgi:hypothetical protein
VDNSRPGGITGGGKNLLAVKKWDGGLALQDCGGIVEKPIPLATGGLNNQKNKLRVWVGFLLNSI